MGMTGWQKFRRVELPLARPLVLSFASPELFMLAVLGGCAVLPVAAQAAEQLGLPGAGGTAGRGGTGVRRAASAAAVPGILACRRRFAAQSRARGH